MAYRSGGMTLVELLVAMFLGALLLALLSNLLGNVRIGWQKAQDAAMSSNEEMTGVRLLLSSLAGALPPNPLEQGTWFRGAPDRLEFLSVPPEAEASRGPMKVRLYATSRPDGGKALIAETEPLRQPVSTQAMLVPTRWTVMDGLEAVTFGFADVQSGMWVEVASWNDPSRLPKLIRIDFLFMDKKIQPLQLTAAPRRNVSGRCSFDLVSLSCRV